MVKPTCARTKMLLHTGLTITGPVLPGGATQSPGDPARFAAANSDGWTADYPNPPVLDPIGNPERFTVLRAGFDAAGQATTLTESLTVTRRLREPYPNQASLTPSTVALSDYVYSSDTVVGAANGSTETSPKPVANWVMPERLVVGDSVTLEVVAFHRNARFGEPVACVEFSATDGTTTVTAKVSAATVSPRGSDRNAVLVYRSILDISALAATSTITCNARVFPWVGTGTSVRDSAEETAARAFSPRVFRRDVARAAAPPMAYVTGTGNDATGVVSTSAASAKAAPFLTILGAIKGLKAANAVTGGRIDGCEVRLGAGSFPAASLATTDVTGGIQDHAAVTITRDPEVPRSAAVFSFGASAFRTRFPYLRIADCTIQRTGTQALTGETATPMQVVLDDVVFDNAGHNAAVVSAAGLHVYGCVLTNATSLPFAAGAGEVRILRGLQCASGVTIENWLVVGCRLTGGNHGSSLFWNGARSSNGAVCAFNYMSGYRINYASLAETIGCAVVQNVVEHFSATANVGFGMSPDGSTMNTSHAIILHNTFAGFFNHGRSNVFYDETAATTRSHRLMVSRGNIYVSVNNKGDVFMADGTRRGNWPFLYGVGCAGDLHQFDAAAPTFRQEFAGPGALVGTSTTTPILPQFAAPAHTVNGTTAGAGGGLYTIAAGSPAKGRAGAATLSFDLAGTPRSMSASSAGAYE
jgi:hypothetical protein